MKQRAFTPLEFSKVLACLADLAVSVSAKQLCLDLTPLGDLEKIKKSQKVLGKAIDWAESSRFKLSPFPPLEGVLERVNTFKSLQRISAHLEIDDLWAVDETLKEARRLDAALEEEAPDFSELIEKPAEWPEKTASALKRCLASDGTLKDESSPELYSVRLEIREIHRKCAIRVKDFVNKNDLGSLMQDDFITISSDRYVLPLRVSHKNKLPGIVHDYSQTGETCYFEPFFMVEINNRLQALKQEEREAEREILIFLSSLVMEELHELEKVYNFLLRMDILLAKTALAAKFDGVHIEVEENAELNLYEARHPLLVLAEAKAIPTGIFLENDRKILVITGANASGKTVCLKTLGLIVLMANSGLPVPAREDSTLPYLENLFVFMGDEQSLEDHLSTFTAQIESLAKAWPEIGSRSLVILDEFGTGTDPAQGAALAQAVLDGLIERKAFVATATHFPALKAYGLSRPEVRAAGMLFDPVSRRPLFRLAYDQVGESGALETAREHGLPLEILSRAERYLLMDGPGTQVFDRLNELASEREKELADLKQSRTSFEKEKKALLERLTKEKKTFLAELREKSQEILREWQLDKSKRKKALRELGALRKTVSIPTGNSDPSLESQDKSLQERKDIFSAVSLGEKVDIFSLGSSGLVVDKDEKRLMFKVEIGGVSLWADAGDVKVRPEAGVFTSKYLQSKPSAVRVNTDKTYKSGLALDLRGFRTEEALAELAGFIDNAILRSVGELEIIHGRGEGILRREVHDFLRRFPSVRSFRTANEDQGGDGVTMVELK